MVRPSFDEYFLSLAFAVSSRGDCTRSQVGSVIVDADRIVVATGYNGVNPGEAGCLDGACPRGRKSYSELPAGGDYSSCIAYHAEANALKFAWQAGQNERVAGGTIYITREPCEACFDLIANAWLIRAVWPGGEQRWEYEAM